MDCGALILVEPSAAGNLGAALRVAANFGVPRVELVRPGVDPADPEVVAWACGAESHVAIRHHDSLAAAAAPYSTLVGTASARGRDALPVISPRDLADRLRTRPTGGTALVFGNETRGLSRADLDRCDLLVRIPTRPAFPVLNLTQSIAIMLGYLASELVEPDDPPSTPATAPEVTALMDHMEEALLAVGFLDPANPQRILRQLRRMLGRAGVTGDEVAILRGICRQMIWARGAAPADDPD